MPPSDPDAVAAALAELLRDPGLRERLGQAGIATAADYAWSRRIDALERILETIASPAQEPPFTGAVPGAAGLPVR